MKRVLFLIFTLLIYNTMSKAQIVTELDFQNYQGEELIYKKGKIDYIKTALKLRDMYGLDKNNAISNTFVIEAPGKAKEEIFVEANNWFIHSFVSAKSTIEFADKDQGVLIGKGYIANVSSHQSMGGSSEVSAWIIVRVDIKDEKFRVITTIQQYDMLVITLATAMVSNEPVPIKQLPSECFPFKGDTFKKNCSKAFVNSHIWSNIVISKLTEAVLNGITGTEDDW